MKKTVYILVLAITFFCSCTGIGFKKPLPLMAEDMKTFPKKYQGKYDLYGDTIEICMKSIKVFEDTIEEYFLSDSLILRGGKQEFFISKKKNDFWTIGRCVPFKQDSIQVYGNTGIIFDEDNKIKELKKLTRLKKYDDFVVLNPRKKQVDKIFNSELFSNYITITRIK